MNWLKKLLCRYLGHRWEEQDLTDMTEPVIFIPGERCARCGREVGESLLLEEPESSPVNYDDYMRVSRESQEALSRSLEGRAQVSPEVYERHKAQQRAGLARSNPGERFYIPYGFYSYKRRM